MNKAKSYIQKQQNFSQIKNNDGQLNINIDDYLCIPIECSLEYSYVQIQQNKNDPKTEIKVELKSVKRTQDQVENTDVQQLSDALSDSQGLLSLLYELKKKNNKLKVMICITAYNEGNEQLELTLQGIKKNLSYFKKQGIDPSEILVTVIFDGINKINDNQDSQEENIFKQTFDPYDLTYKISKKKTMRYQKTQYQKYEKWSTLTLDQIDSDEELKEMLDKQINENVAQRPNFISVEDFKLETKRKLQQECKKQGLEYIKQRENSAWIYQDRIPILNQQIEKQQGADLNYNDQNSDDEQQDYEQQNINYQNNNRDSQNQNNLFSVNEQKVKNQIQSVLEQEYLNIMYVAKFKNGTKLNSHLWFFKGFCQLLEPKYVVLIDTGLEPHRKSIFNFFETMELNKNIGGVCGFMAIRTQRVVNDYGQRQDDIDERLDFLSNFLHRLFNIQKAQQFEYDMAHIIDKAFESLFGFIHVLPGAFSGYRYDAIKNSLKGYLKTQLNKKYVSSSLQERNMFLAEDRILCLDLYCTESYYIQYVPNALAYVDPVINLNGLIGQRRRWINGSWHALNYVLQNYQLKQKLSKHSMCDKVKLFLLMQYSKLGQFLTYFSVSIYFIFLYMIFHTVLSDKYLPQPDSFKDQRFEYTNIKYLSFVLYIFIIIFGGMIFFSLNYQQNNKKAIGIYYFFSTIFGIYVLTSFYFMVDNIIKTIFPSNQNDDSQSEQNDEQQNNFSDDELQLFKVIILITLGLHILPVICDSLYRIRNLTFFDKYWSLLICLIPFTFYSPTYILMFIIYSFCNLDIFSWGTKGNDSEQINEQQEKKEKLLKQLFAQQKFWFISKWLVLNIIFASIFSILVSYKEYQKTIMLILVGFGLAFMIIRCVGAILFYIILGIKNGLYFCQKRRQKLKDQYKHNKMAIQNTTKQIVEICWQKKDTKNSIILKEEIKQNIQYTSKIVYDQQQSFMNQNNIQINDQQKSIISKYSRFIAFNDIRKQYIKNNLENIFKDIKEENEDQSQRTINFQRQTDNLQINGNQETDQNLDILMRQNNNNNQNNQQNVISNTPLSVLRMQNYQQFQNIVQYNSAILLQKLRDEERQQQELQNFLQGLQQ